MKILFLVWESLGGRHMVKALENKGFEISLFKFSKDEDAKRSKEQTVAITEELLKGGYDFVFSFNYFPTVAIACKAGKVTYVSWVYDNPCIEMYSQTVKYETNRVFVFDSSEYLKFRNMGIDTVHYLPLASDAAGYESIIREAADSDKYSCDVAFVGATKNEKSERFKAFDNLDEYTKGYIKGIVSSQKSIYGMNFVEKALSPMIMDRIKKVFPMNLGEDTFATPQWLIAGYYIDQMVTGQERCEILSMLSEKYRVNLYTLEPTPDMPKVNNMGEVDYYSQAPLVFNRAKINLNISLKSITSGIPLRALDIMASKGFLLTNYQQDFLEHFEPDVDFVYYDSYEDLMAKAEYYLSHEKERLEIAENGFEKMKSFHTYEARIEEMFK
ncbi:MAG: DUF3880 domain-containing protein [Butyrivibrio sp.]|nr:DUF3880 domain-containing protein [Butyrivibrio sp.]